MVDEESTEVRQLDLSVQAAWSGHYNDLGKWVSLWPIGVCKECGESFQGTPTQVWCSDLCRKKAASRSNRHARRTRKAAIRDGRTYPPYEIIGRYELLHAFDGLCAKCGKTLPLEDAWVGHIVGVEYGGQHTRRNIAPVHKACEQRWNVEQRRSKLSSTET